jgi:hypothetical protein
MVEAGWRQVSGRRWERRDGAVVKWDDSSPYPNPEVAGSRLWTAWEPDPHQGALSMSRGFQRYAPDARPGHRYWRPRFPRRWKTAAAAMRAVDREYPLASL